MDDGGWERVAGCGWLWVRRVNLSFKLFFVFYVLYYSFF